MESATRFQIVFLLLFVISVVCSDSAANSEAQDVVEEEKKLDEETLKYAKGSLCGYCDYCKFCKLCDEQCPCKTSDRQPNCDACKYCKYCKLCSLFCDSICKPGGVVDTVSSTVFNMLPSFNKEEVDADLKKMEFWINKKKDEL